jgi:AraC family L-rhamnose operon regulatory protein RhaS
MKIIDKFSFMVGNNSPISVRKYHHEMFVPAHSHKFYEFVYVESGFCSHFINNKVHILFPGCLFGMKPFDTHEYYNVKHTCIYNCLFYPEAIEESFLQFSQLPGLDQVFSSSGSNNWLNLYINPVFQTEVVTLLIKMSKECEEEKSGFIMMLKSQLTELLILLSRAYEHGQIDLNNEKYLKVNNVLRITEYINENYSKPLSVEMLAEIADMNVDYFSRTFKKAIGMTPIYYLNIVKISRAYNMLIDSDMSVSEISEKVGIDDPNYFSRLFKMIIRKTPSEVRKLDIMPGNDLEISH